jgi:hypothetical protein
MAVGGKGLRAELKQKPILWAVLACFVFETGMNALFGYRQAGGGWSLAALLYGAIFIGLAFLGAWTCVELFKVRGRDGFAWARRAAFAVPFAGCLAVSQFSGWGVLGVTLADGGARRDVAATKSLTAAETLAAKKAEKARVGTPRAIGAIEADLDLELRRTSKQYPNGNGPKATALKGELEAARRYAALEQEIAAAMKALDEAPAVAGGNPEFAVVTGWTGAQPSDVRKWWSVFLVALIGSFANFGFALAGVGQDPDPPKRAAAFIDPMNWGPKQLGNGGAQQLYDEMVERFGPDTDAHVAALEAKLAEARRGRQQAAGNGQQQFTDDMLVPGRGQWRTPPAPQEMAPVHTPPLSGPPPAFPPNIDVGTRHSAFGGAPDAHAFGASAHGAPIAIHNHFSGAPPAIGYAPERAAPVAPEARERQVPEAREQQAEPVAQPAPALPPLLTGPPVDRGATQAKIDHLLMFKRACLVAMPGAIVSNEDMYARYVAWAGPRCLNEPLFHTLFAGLCEVPVSAIGGVLIYADVAVRTQLPKEIAS